MSVEHLEVRHGSVVALDDVTFDLADDDFVGVVGPSGAGKTTLLRVLLGLVTPTAGRLVRRDGLRVGYVPQLTSVDWSFPLTVKECVLLARARQRSVPWTNATERRECDAVLDQLGLTGLGGRHISELSGGQQQRVFVARALIGRPQLLVLDEPTSGVDVRTRHELFHLLADLHRDGSAILLATHDLNGLAAHLPRLVCLNQRVVAAGSPAEVLRPGVLERTYGAPFEVLVHAGLPVVLERTGVTHHHHAKVAQQ